MMVQLMLTADQPHLRVAAFEQSAQQSAKQGSLLTAAFAADSGVGGWQQTTEPCSVLVQDVTDLLQGCFAYCQRMVCQSI